MNKENSITFNSGTFSFSAADINSLESSEYTLVVICLDSSASINGFNNEMEKCVKTVIESCSKSPRSDNLMIRLVTFDSTVKEYHGFKELNKCQIDSYDGILKKLGGSTSLYDAALNGLESLKTYGKELSDADYSTNGLFVLITDGDDNNSSYTVNDIKKSLSQLVGEKKLESLVSILIGVNTNDAGINILLKNLASTIGMEYVDIAKADAKSLAKLAQFISKSISSVSQSLASGSQTSLSF